MPTGRPTLYNPGMHEKICLAIASGKTLLAICKPKDMPSRWTVLNWTKAYPDFAADLRAAREWMAFNIADEMLERIKTIIKDKKLMTSEEIAALRLAIDSEKWLAGKHCARIFGDKQQVDLELKKLPTLKITFTTEENKPKDSFVQEGGQDGSALAE